MPFTDDEEADRDIQEATEVADVANEVSRIASQASERSSTVLKLMGLGLSESEVSTLLFKVN